MAWVLVLVWARNLFGERSNMDSDAKRERISLELTIEEVEILQFVLQEMMDKSLQENSLLQPGVEANAVYRLYQDMRELRLKLINWVGIDLTAVE